MRPGTTDIALCILFGIILPCVTPLFIWLIEKLNEYIIDKFRPKDNEGGTKK